MNCPHCHKEWPEGYGTGLCPFCGKEIHLQQILLPNQPRMNWLVFYIALLGLCQAIKSLPSPSSCWAWQALLIAETAGSLRAATRPWPFHDSVRPANVCIFSFRFFRKHNN
jgi:hypothetical protein